MDYVFHLQGGTRGQDFDRYTIIYTTTKDIVSKKRAVCKRNQQAGSVQVIFLVTPLPMNISESGFRQ